MAGGGGDMPEVHDHFGNGLEIDMYSSMYYGTATCCKQAENLLRTPPLAKPLLH